MARAGVDVGVDGGAASARRGWNGFGVHPYLQAGGACDEYRFCLLV